MRGERIGRLEECEAVSLQGVLDGKVRPARAGERTFIVAIDGRHAAEITIRTRVKPAGGRAPWRREPTNEEVVRGLTKAMEMVGEEPVEAEDGEEAWMARWERDRDELVEGGGQ